MTLQTRESNEGVAVTFEVAAIGGKIKTYTYAYALIKYNTILCWINIYRTHMRKKVLHIDKRFTSHGVCMWCECTLTFFVYHVEWINPNIFICQQLSNPPILLFFFLSFYSFPCILSKFILKSHKWITRACTTRWCKLN